MTIASICHGATVCNDKGLKQTIIETSKNAINITFEVLIN